MCVEDAGCKKCSFSKVNKSTKMSEDKLMQSCVMAVTELQNIKCHFVTYRNNEDV